MVVGGGMALAQTPAPTQPNQNQSNQQGQAPRAPGQISNANAEPTPPPLGGPGFSADPTSHQTDLTGGNTAWDRQFINNAAMRGMRQLDAAKLALDKSSNPSVKEYAQKVLEEQGKATGMLKRMAGKESITFPATLDPREQADVDRLSKLSGAEFDRAYIRDEIRIHERALRDFQREARDGQDDKVKAFAVRVLPMVTAHLQTAKQMSTK